MCYKIMDDYIDKTKMQEWIAYLDREPYLIVEDMVGRKLRWYERIVFNIQYKLHTIKLHKTLNGRWDILWFMGKAWKKVGIKNEK